MKKEEEIKEFPGITGKLIGVGLGGIAPMLFSRIGGLRGMESEEEKRRREQQAAGLPVTGMKKGGKVKTKSSSSASKRGDGIAQRGKTKGRFV